MRVSSFNRFDVAQHYMNATQAKMVTEQQQISTGKYFQVLSDDPIRANQSLVVNNSISRIQQYAKNVNDIQGFLSTVETTLGSVGDIMQNTKDIAVKAANGVWSSVDRNTMATSIEENIQHIVSLANTKYLDKYIFSGEKSQTASFTYNGASATYNGDSNVPKIAISSQNQMKTSESGDVLFQNLLNQMINLRDQVKTGTTTSIGAAMASFETEMNNVIDKRSEIGVRMESANMIGDVYTSNEMELEKKKTNIEEVDWAKVVSDYANSTKTYQAVLQSSKTLFNVSMLNFM